MEKLTFWGKLFFVIIYVIALYLCFYGATFMDPYIGMAYSGLPLIIGFFITVNYLIVSIINKKINPLIFCFVFLIISSFMGKLYINYRVKKLNEIGTKIEEYYKENKTEIFDKKTLENILNINENVNIIYNGNSFTVEYINEDRFYYNSNNKKVRFRNIP